MKTELDFVEFFLPNYIEHKVLHQEPGSKHASTNHTTEKAYRRQSILVHNRWKKGTWLAVCTQLHAAMHWIWPYYCGGVN